MALVFAVAAPGSDLLSSLYLGKAATCGLGWLRTQTIGVSYGFGLTYAIHPSSIYTCIYLIIVVLPCSIRSCLKWYYLFLTVWMCRGLRFEQFASKLLCLQIRGRTQVDLVSSRSNRSSKSCPIHEAFGSSGKAHKRLGLIAIR